MAFTNHVATVETCTPRRYRCHYFSCQYALPSLLSLLSIYTEKGVMRSPESAWIGQEGNCDTNGEGGKGRGKGTVGGGRGGKGEQCSANPTARPRAPPPVCSIPDIFDAASDGDFVAGLEAAALVLGGATAVSAAYSLVASDQDAQPPQPRPTPVETISSLTVTVDLGPGGEPKGEQRLLFKPKLSMPSTLVKLELKVPLGLLSRDMTQRYHTPSNQKLESLSLT